MKEIICSNCHQEDGNHKMSCPTKKLLLTCTANDFESLKSQENVLGDFKTQTNFEDYIENEPMKEKITKPIFVIRFPNSISPEEVADIKQKIVKTQGFILEDYHLLVIRDVEYVGKVEFECYNSNCTEIEFNELKEKLEKYVKN